MPLHPQWSTRPRRPPPERFLWLVLLGALALSAQAVFAATPVLDTLAVCVGEAPDDWFGVSVANAGDVNGDGIADVIVGAYSHDVNGTDAGRAYLFWGGPGMDAVPDRIFTGTSFEDYFGTSVSGAGDMNGDGYADLIVGSPADDIGLTNSGAAFVFFGGPSMDEAPDLILAGEAAEDYFGLSVAGAGDVNGDGYDDVIVGAWNHDGTAPNSGSAYVYFGGPAPDGVPDLTILGAREDDNLGIAVAGAGDLNGDGFADMVAGASLSDEAGDGAGSARVYFGGAAPDTTPDLILLGAAGYENFGAAVSAAGDVNGDGHNDLVVGATYGGPQNQGRAFLFFGGPGLDATPDLVFTGEGAGDFFGSAVASAGDIDGDGDADLVVGARYADAGHPNAGRAYVFFGGMGMDAMADLIVTGAASFDNLGFSVCGGGDVNGDGWPELLVGATFGGLGVGQTLVLTVDGVTEVLAPRFSAHTTAEGIQLEWTVRGDEIFERAALERAPAAVGPWVEIAGSRTASSWSAEWLDSGLERGRSYFYRITVELSGGRERYFGPISARAPGEPTLALAVTPQPVRAAAWIDYVIPRAGPVSLSLFDVQGRECSRLVDRVHEAGVHRARWPAGLAHGIYLLRLVAGDARVARTVAVVR